MEQMWHGAPLDGVVLIDPNTRKPYTAAFTQTVVEGGEIDVTSLNKESTQQSVLEALQSLPRAGATQAVTIQNENLPMAVGAATSEAQQATNSALAQIQAILSSGIPTTLQNQSIAATIESLPLPAGAATSALQQSLLSYLQSGDLVVGIDEVVGVEVLDLPAVELAANQTVGISGPVMVQAAPNAPLAVTGTVELGNNDVDATIVGPVAVSGIATPVPITDNGGSITVDVPQGIAVSQSALPDGAATQATLAAVNTKLPASLGQKAAADSLAVVLASGTTLATSAPVGGTPTLTSVASSASSVQLRPANANRKGLVIFNNSTSILHINVTGATASATTAATHRIAPGQTWEAQPPVPTTAITGIWATANGTAQVTEIV